MKKQRILSLLAAITLTLPLASCSSSSPEFNSYTGSYAKSDAAYDYAYPEEAEMAWEDADVGMSGYDSAPSPDPSNDLSERKIIRTATVNFETTGYEAFLESLNTCVADAGGYIESSETYGGGIYSSYSSRSASITVRVPASRYDAFMSSVTEIGAMTYRSESKDDVTMSYIDVESHIRALETEYSTLLEILDKAESLEDVILLQNRISEVNYELDSYKSQLRKYDDLISYCTIHIGVNEVRRETLPDERTLTFGERIVTGLRENFLDIGEGAADFAVWFVTSIPYLLIWAVVIAVIVLVIRAIMKKYRRKKEQKALEDYMRSQNNETKEPPHDGR